MKRLTTEQFIEKAKKLHSNKYDYSLTEYKNRRSEVKIICPIHGEFTQIADYHLTGRGCDKCGGTYTKTTKEFIKIANKIHNNKYNYSLVEYKNNFKKVKIICPKHGIFIQSPSNHINHKSIYPKCNNIQRSENMTLTTNDFIEKANIVHENTYDYSLVDYKNSHKKISIICKKHGIFKQTPNNHLRGKGCSICNESKGEKIIKKFLKENGIRFIPQKRFKKCKNILPLPFDFYLPEYNTCIEYNGIQHYKVFDYFGGIEKFNKNEKNFNIKMNFCDENNIKLIVIKYDENIIDSLSSHYKDST